MQVWMWEREKRFCLRAALTVSAAVVGVVVVRQSSFPPVGIKTGRQRGFLCQLETGLVSTPTWAKNLRTSK